MKDKRALSPAPATAKPGQMTGKITYRLYQIKKRLITDEYKFSHDDALNITSKWFHNSTVDENIAVVSNYPWVYKNKSEILDDIDEYKILVIPPLSIFGRMSLPKIRSSILHDKYARLNEILKLVDVAPKSVCRKKQQQPVVVDAVVGVRISSLRGV